MSLFKKGILIVLAVALGTCIVYNILVITIINKNKAEISESQSIEIQITDTPQN